MRTTAKFMRGSFLRNSLLASATLFPAMVSVPALAAGNNTVCGAPFTGNTAGNPGDYNAACGIGNQVFGYYPNLPTEQLNNSAFGIQNEVKDSKNSTALGVSNLVNGVENSTAVGASNSITNNYSTAVGSSNETYGVANSTVGIGNVVGNDQAPTASAFSSAFGNENRVIGPAGSSSSGFDASTAVGEANKVYGNQNVAIGNRNSIGSQGNYYNKSFAGGMQATVYGNNSIAIGYQAAAGQGNGAFAANSATALGSSARVESNNSIALGAGSLAQGIHGGPGDYSINGGTPSGLPSAANGVLSIGDANAERQIQNVAAGVVSATSTDAVNGSQLYAVGTAVNTGLSGAAGGLGGGAAWNPATGTWTAPSYNVNGTAHNNVGDALGAVNNSANNLGVSTAAALGGGSTYTAGAGVSAPNYSVQGKNYNNVGNAITALDNNVSGLNNSVNNLGAQVGGLWQNMSAVKQGVQRGYEGTAVALAAAPAMLSQGKKFAIATNWGGFRGQNAFGASALVRVHDNVILNAGIGVGLQYSGVGGRAGALFEW